CARTGGNGWYLDEFDFW
nr:immunoglobulin heavy chain junction region [Macaca mulatta]MOV86922.1 immunoglobulin heavy chain junction region [Macaca mulatta]MOV87236.1 immunoglobulin heavy chain junction region [Macaca mulatta]MOV87619.1 immunoglobulin heavy chain junction region [Macaca mulatta]MOV87939.1 immunoglobulin heavy chain junction region [Macaca mulatta]